MEPEHPDDFLLGMWEREPRLMISVFCEQAADTGRRGPRLSPSQVADYLAACGARRFADRVRPYLPKAEEAPA